MDKDTLEQMKKFQTELNRWKHTLRNELIEHTEAPDYLIARMSTEEMILYLLESTGDNE